MTLADPTMKLTTGFTLKNSQAVGNSANGVQFDGITATDVTFKNATIAQNMLDGVFIEDRDLTDTIKSVFTDFVIQDSHIGEAPDGMGGTLTGNGANGFLAANTTFTGVAFLDWFFNQNGFDGILVETSTSSRHGDLNDGMPEVLDGSLDQGLAGHRQWRQRRRVRWRDRPRVTLKGDLIAENGTVTADGLGVGVFIRDTDLNDGSESRFSNFVIGGLVSGPRTGWRCRRQFRRQCLVRVRCQ